MKRFLIKLWFGFIMVALLVGVSFAAIFADNSVLTEALGRGRLQLDTQVAYLTASEVLTGTIGVNRRWQSLSDGGFDYVTYLDVPVRITYGLLDNFSLRLTLPYASFNTRTAAGVTSTGSGLANIELEGLYKFFGESGGRSSLSALLKYKLGTGKKISELTTGELYVGSRSTDITLAIVAGKKLGVLTGKMLLGYMLTSPYKEQTIPGGTEVDVNIADQIVYALSLAYPVNDRLEILGELWGTISSGKEKWSAAGVELEIDQSERSSMIFTPLVSFKMGEQFTLRGSADLILSKSASSTLNIFDWFKYTTYRIGMTYSL